jgi:hypothetical protein
MADVSRPVGETPTTGPDGVGQPSAAAGPLLPRSPAVDRVGWGFISLYALAYMGTTLQLLAPVLVTLALKVNSSVGSERAPSSLALVTGIGSLLAMAADPFFGRLSDRTSSQWGMRRPWMLIGLTGGALGIVVVALAPSIPVVLTGWCITQLFCIALLAVQVAVLLDQVPAARRGLVSGVLGICLPIAAVSGTFLFKLFSGSRLAMFLAPCVSGGVLRPALRGHAAGPPARRGGQTGSVAARTRRHLLRGPAAEPGLGVGVRQPLPVRPGLRLPDDVPGLLPAGRARECRGRGAAPDLPRHGRPVQRRRPRVPGRWPALRPDGTTEGLRPHRGDRARPGHVPGRHRRRLHRLPGGDGLSGLGFGIHVAVDLALVTDVLPDGDNARDLGVLNIADALPFSVAPATAPAVLAIGSGSYGVLYVVAGVCAVAAAVAVLPVKRVR